MDKTLKDLADHRFDKAAQQMKDLAAGFGAIERSTMAFKRDDYQGKRLDRKVWKKKQSRRRMQQRSRKNARP
jgi:hypothetical protein